MNIKPTLDRIIVKRLAPESTSKGGIVIPDMAREQQVMGEILAVGPGKKHPLDVKVGDVVMFGTYAGEEFKHDGEMYTMIVENDLIGVVEQ